MLVYRIQLRERERERAGFACSRRPVATVCSELMVMTRRAERMNMTWRYWIPPSSTTTIYCPTILSNIWPLLR